MTQEVPVLLWFVSDFEETARIAERANQSADQTSRGLLQRLLPIPNIKTGTLRTSRNRFNQKILSLFSATLGLLRKNEAMIINEAHRRQLEVNVEKERSKKSERAYSLFYSLSFEDLLPFFFDYKLKGLDYVISKWAKHLPVEETQVARYIIVSKPEPEITRLYYQKAEEKEDDDKET